MFINKYIANPVIGVCTDLCHVIFFCFFFVNWGWFGDNVVFTVFLAHAIIRIILILSGEVYMYNNNKGFQFTNCFCDK